MDVKKRTSVPLTAKDVEDLAKLRSPDTLEYASLVEILHELDLGDLAAEPSEAAVLQALLAIGLKRARDAALERGYAELAASLNEEDDQVAKASRARRNARRRAEDAR